MNYSIFIVFIVFTSGVTGQMLICQDDSTMSDNNLCECNDDQFEQFYNAYEGQCQDICTYYSDYLCGYYANAKCLIDPDNPSNYTCDCPTGFESSNNSNTGVNCVDLDECKSGNYECDTVNNEVCVNLFGDYGCSCFETYFRNESGQCQEINVCNQPGLKKCQQICIPDSQPFNYTCECYDGFTPDVHTGNCVLDEGFVNCSCSPNNPSWSSCIQYDNGTDSCYPNLGYQKNNETGNIEDLDECTSELYPSECIENSICFNQEGKYACECNNDYELNTTLFECTRITCRRGYALYNQDCRELCSLELGPQCPYDTVCLVDDNNIPFCECQVACQMNGNRNNTKTLYVYKLYTVLPYEHYYNTGINPYDLYRITKSFETIFGRGNAQLMKYIYDSSSGELIWMAIGLYEALQSIDDLAVMVKDICFPIDAFGVNSKCVLPFGIIADIDSISADFLYPCQSSSLCANANSAQCVDSSTNGSIPDGNYECQCRSGFEPVDGLEEIYCIDINECTNPAKYNCSTGYICENLPGYFTCADINECDKPITNNCSTGYICENFPGFFRCSDINECYYNSTICDVGYYCENTPGSHNCISGNGTVSDLASQLEDAQNDLKDQEHKTKVVGGVLGALLAVAVILLIAVAIYTCHHRS